jgi:hypothetical protein
VRERAIGIVAADYFQLTVLSCFLLLFRLLVLCECRIESVFALQGCLLRLGKVPIAKERTYVSEIDQYDSEGHSIVWCP